MQYPFLMHVTLALGAAELVSDGGSEGDALMSAVCYH